MANRLAFHYLPGHSFLHRWDARCKLLGLLGLTIGMLYVPETSLALSTLLLAVILPASRIPLKSLFSDMKSWWLLLTMVFLVQAFLSPQEAVPLSASAAFPTGLPSLKLAALTCWRLTLIITYALLFTAVTRPRDLQESVIWILAPLPFLPRRRIALMVTLMVRFLPLILDQADEVRQAIRCRRGNRRLSPVRAIKVLVLPLFRRSLIRADAMALALAARGYREDIPVQLPPPPAVHVLFLVLLLAAIMLSSTGVSDKLIYLIRA